ncbi:uncharacterized protein DS421_8g243540 [Arachis hypogaea]|nr:uncharacterized protein DS421_8g243540 [Arachis hypogaea]
MFGNPCQSRPKKREKRNACLLPFILNRSCFVLWIYSLKVLMVLIASFSCF